MRLLDCHAASSRGAEGEVFPWKRCATLCGGDNRLTCAGRARTAGAAFTGGACCHETRWTRESRVREGQTDGAREAGTMSMVERGALRCVNTDELSWRPSAFARGVLVKDIAVTDGWEMQIVRFEPGARFPIHTHERPEFVFILEGELIQGGRRLRPGWASVASAGSVDEDVHSDTGCVFVLVDRA
jgi:ChrR Cupin-like domain